MRENKESMDSVLFIHEVNYRTKPIFEMHEFPEILASKGVQVAFLHFEEGAKFWRGWKRKSYEDIKGRVIKSVAIRLISPFQLGIPGLDRLIALISVPFALFRELKNNPPKIVVSYSFPTGGLVAIVLARFFRVPHLQRVIDYSPGLRRFPLSLILKVTDLLVFRFGQNFSTHNSYLADRIRKLADPLRANVFLNLPPIKSFAFDYTSALTKIPEFENKLIGRKLNLVFLGTLYKFSGITDVVETLMISDRIKAGDVFLHIFGLGHEEGELRQIIDANKQKDVAKFYGFLDFEKINYVFSKCDIGIVPFHNALVSDFSLPNKALQYVAAGLPVVSTPLKGLSSVIDSSAMFCFRSLEELPALLMDLIDNEDRLNSAKKAAHVVAKRFDYETTSTSLIETLEQVMKSG
jgi:glycosyltransferase involved in cell wall biosynthesis